MPKLTNNEIQIYLNKRGYDILPERQPNGNYKMMVWVNDEKCLGLGEREWGDWYIGVQMTYKLIYDKICSKQRSTPEGKRAV